MYPNPANNVLYVNVSKRAEELYKLSIIDIYGNKLREYNNINSSSYSIDISDMAKGIYFIKIKLDDFYHVEKLIKQ
ncbi:MAG: T9SS type A sorting domain-containing protein [Bacteroidales bacterium]